MTGYTIDFGQYSNEKKFNLIKGKIIKINQTDKKYKVPVIGWNKVKILNTYFKKINGNGELK